jgi:hypothetical protein
VTPAVLLTLVSPTVAVAIALWGFRRSTRADKLRAFFEMHERYLAMDVRAGRRLVHEVVQGRSVDEVAALERSVLSSVGYTLAVMNSIAVACEGGYVERRLISRSMGRSYVAAMAAAGPYIDYVEDARGYRPYIFAERLAARLDQVSEGTPGVRRRKGLEGDDVGASS